MWEVEKEHAGKGVGIIFPLPDSLVGMEFFPDTERLCFIAFFV